MGFMQRLKNGFVRLMYGRNGVDQLGMATIWTCLILDIVSMFLQRRVPVAGAVLYWGAMALWVYAIFRMFSKNLYKRREENSRWVQLRWKFQSNHQNAKARHADKEHKYFTCKNCKTICRVPVGKGNVEITCPKCGAKIRGKT
jgi:RNase P subunit RPR2